MQFTKWRAGEGRRPFYQDKSVQVFGGLVIGVLIGAVWPQRTRCSVERSAIALPRMRPVGTAD